MSDVSHGSNGSPRLVRGEVLLDAETRRRINRAHFRRTMAVLSVLSLVGALVAIYLSPLLRVQTVEVTGTTNLDPSAVEALVQVDGESMLTVSFDDARARIAENPLVRSVQIERDWPNGVKVTVTERVPWASWQVGEETYVIDREGFVIPAPAPAGPVVVHTDATNTPAEGERIDFDAIRVAAQLLEAVPPRLQVGITSMEWSSIGGMTIGTDAGYRVVVGGEDDLNYKLTVWAAVDSAVGRAEMNGHVLDLRYGDRPSLQ